MMSLTRRYDRGCLGAPHSALKAEGTPSL